MDNEELGYACGVLCGRGFIKRGRNNCVGIHTDKKDLAEQFASSLRNMAGYDIGVKEKIINNKRYFTVHAYGKGLVAVFDGVGFAPTRKTWSPPMIIHENPEFRSGFLAGFFDATSFVYLNREKFSVLGSGYRYVRVTSVNPSGLEEVKKLLSSEGVESNLRISKKGLVYLIIRGTWRLKMFSERINLRTQKKNAVNSLLQADD